MSKDIVITLLNDTRAIDRAINAAITSGGKFGQVLHLAAYNCLVLCANNNDVRPLNRLYAGLTPAARDALQLWAVKFGNVHFSQKQKAFSHDKKRTADVSGMLAIGPMDYRKEKVARQPVAFDLKAELERILKRAEKHNISGKPVQLIEQAIRAA